MPIKSSSIVSRAGSGLITGASDDDPSGIATYSQAGAQFGLNTLWLAFVTLPLMIVIQEMCARIGMVTKTGLTGNLARHYPRSLLFFILFLTIPAIIFNMAADIASVGAVAEMLYPAIDANIYSVIFVLALILGIVFLSYNKIERTLKYLCLSLLVYLIIPFLGDLSFLKIIRQTFLPDIQWNKEFINIFIAILGTTISPYLFFWQATMEAQSSKKNHSQIITAKQKKFMRWDVFSGMLISNTVMYFIILTSGTILYPHGIHHIATVNEAAKALEPLAGKGMYLLFALGIIGTGSLAIPVLGCTVSYMLSTTFKLPEGLDKPLLKAKSFYFIIFAAMLVSLLINFLKINPIQALIFSAMGYGIISPVLIFLILMICNNKKIMKNHTNSLLSNTFGILCFLGMTLSVILFFIFFFI